MFFRAAQSLVLLTALIFPLPLLAQREPVLKQIDLPHSYYFREMYLPQLTTGPSSVAWSPDGKWLVYSRAGSLWRQRPDSEIAVQLTAGPGYDYQPDWSPDGRWIVFSRYDGGAIELWRLDVESGAQKQLTQGGHVNVEPRWSPDGSRIVYVSTAYNRRFHIFVLHLKDGEPAPVQFPTERLTGETRSDKPRYYYSQFDHEISPTWSPDAREIIFVSNRGHFYGTGGFWRMEAKTGAEAREFHSEETTWKARPDWSRDGKRLVFSSYLGRQWHQLWVTTPDGGSAFPLTYGEYDNTAARWSPDGSRVAFISNRDGNTSLWIMDLPGGAQRQVIARERKYLRPMGKLRISVLDAAGRPTAARVSVTDSDGRAYAPDDAWMHADDGFVRAQRRFEAHYFHITGQAELSVPAGRVHIEVMKGFEHHLEQRRADVFADRVTTVPVRLRPLAPLPADTGKRWASGDLHVHMNYAGAYRNTPARLAQQAAAENLSVVHDLIVNKEQRIPDISYFTGKPDPVSHANFLLLHDQEFHTSYWGHMGLLGMTRNYLIPDYAGYPETAAASLWPTNSFIADLAHQQGALVGYVHPYEIEDAPDPAKDRPLRHAFVVDAALGKADYVEVLGFSDHHSTASIWYRLLNLGFRIPAGAGTDAMANYASLHGPVGLNRVYARVSVGPLKREEWLDAVRRGNGFATNGPLLDFTLGGQAIGGELKLATPDPEVRFTASMRSLVPLDHLEVVCNGRVVRTLEMNATRDQADVRGSIPLDASGWCLLRAWSEKPQHPILDIYPYATTSPIYVSVSGERPRSPEDAKFCIAWIDRIRESVEKFTDWNTDAEREETFKTLSEARNVYEGMLK
ncbi:MAG TPA: CehA/McbA family metallohydrolase [Terriglobales bacterium]|nr:CehA/McbA family metallohydrolase [Terriglobales bacterium]